MKLFASLLVLSFGALLSPAAAQTPASAQAAPASAIAGIWEGAATVRGGAQVPIALRISGGGQNLKLVLLNGPAGHPDESPASSVSFDGAHLVAAYDYFARKLDATLAGGTLTGTYGSASPTSRAAPTPFTLARVAKATDPAAAAGAPDIHGSWWIETTSAKAESAWEFRVDPPSPNSPVIKAVIQRIDGDTGGLWGTWNGTSYTVGHFNAAGAALYSVTPQPDGTLLVKNLVQGGPGGGRRATTDQASAAGAAPAAPTPDVRPTEYIARRAELAKQQNLRAPTDPTQQTSVKDPSVPFHFAFPDLEGKTVSNSDPRYSGKVVIVAVGGSWCPNCHDEAPFLVSFYNRFHAQGLEIVGLDFGRATPRPTFRDCAPSSTTTSCPTRSCSRGTPTSSPRRSPRA
jgi:thiol-disulfide isomerase/thioredoxin